MRFMMIVIPKGYQSAAPDFVPSAEAVAKTDVSVGREVGRIWDVDRDRVPLALCFVTGHADDLVGDDVLEPVEPGQIARRSIGDRLPTLSSLAPDLERA